MAEHLQRLNTAVANIKSFDDFARAMEGLLDFKSEASRNLIKTEPIPKTDWKQYHSELQSPFISGLVFEQVRIFPVYCTTQTPVHMRENYLNRPHTAHLKRA